ncbi:MAG: LPS export ABC transporter permease LptG [Alphaproteobacteria bacterium]
MRLSLSLSTYIGRQFLFWFGCTLGALLGVTFILDMIELLRRAAAKPEATLDVVFAMAALKLPLMAEQLLSFAILFGGMFVFARMTRSHELVVARAAGISAWQFMLPAIALALLIGAFNIAVFNPIASITTSRFEWLEGSYLRGRSSLLAVSSAGLWLRQGDESGRSIVHAERVLPNSMDMQGVIIFLFEEGDRFAGRIDAKEASLKQGYWQLTDAWLTAPDRPPRFERNYEMKTNLTIHDVQDSFASPETMSFWDLPAFIKVLENAGFSATQHRLYWNTLLASPVLLCAMVLVAATFTLRLTRRGGTALLVAGGVAVGFLLYFLSDIVYALGLSARIPVVLAAWAPAGVSVLLGLAMLLHLEDG